MRRKAAEMSGMEARAMMAMMAMIRMLFVMVCVRADYEVKKG